MGDGSGAATPIASGSDAGSSHPAFRLAEKHFKNRTTRALPPLRDIPSDLCLPVLDLSRPSSSSNLNGRYSETAQYSADGGVAGESQPTSSCDSPSSDEVYNAGWWARTYGDPRKRIGEKGERQPVNLDGIEETEVDGRKAYIVGEGCILIPSYLSPTEQEQLALSALSSYTLPPNPLSVDVHYATPPNLFELYATKPETTVQPRHSELDEAERRAHEEAQREKAGTRRTVTTAPAATPDLTTMLQPAPPDTISVTAKPRTVEQLMTELRWANLGWIYRWTTKVYDFSQRISFPEELGKVCRSVVRSALPNYHDYEPDTGIVNFYQLRDSLMAHVDRSELDNSRPLVSISLGHACIFLLGTEKREDPPRPLILRSGDLLIMFGKGRQSYHGVPRIMEGTLPSHFQPRETDSPQMQAAKQFISTARININARQVVPPGVVV